MNLHEQELERKVLCSWMPPGETDPLFYPSVRTLRWALLERFNGPVPSAGSLRAKFLQNWQKTWGDRKKEGQEYWIGPKASVSFGAKVYQFLLKHEVTKPLQTYELELPDGSISGQLAVVAQTKVRKPSFPYVLDVCLRRPKEWRVPHYKALARWVAERQVNDSVDLGIAHLPLLYGETWCDDTVDEALARQWLGSILRQTDFPRPGAHCRSCPHPCKVFRNGQDDHNWD